MTTATPTDARSLLRHTLATLAYRAEKVLRGTDAAFGGVRAGPDSRSALALVEHLGDLMEWAARMARELTTTVWNARELPEDA